MFVCLSWNLHNLDATTSELKPINPGSLGRQEKQLLFLQRNQSVNQGRDSYAAAPTVTNLESATSTLFDDSQWLQGLFQLN